MSRLKPLRTRVALTAAAAAAVAGLVVPAAAAAAPTDPPGTFMTTDIAGAPVSPYAAYRIPALAALGNGVVLAAWDGRPGSAADAPNPNSLVLTRSTDAGKTWGAPTTVLAGRTTAPKAGYSDPSLVYDAVTRTVFLFSVYSKDQGFAGSAYGNDDADRSIISAQVSSSTDGGLTWSGPRLITSVVKPGSSATSPAAGDVRGMFATSGEGIQLRYGAHAGRLIQQFAGDVRQADGSNTIQAYSVYSDDHGATWQRGAFVGSRMDENKVVELSDGRVLLNSRDNAGGGYRRVAVSTDGGQTYGPVTQDTELPDPTNNAAITRVYPDAPAGSLEAKVLLFTNTASQSSRTNLTARVSCDDGATWPYARQLNAGYGGYSIATRLDARTFGVLYESSSFTAMPFARFDDAWLAAPCDGLARLDALTISGSRTDTGRNLAASPYAAGDTVPYAFTVRNHGAAAANVAPTSGNLAPLVPPGTGNCRYTGLASGASYTCSTPRHTVTAAEAVQGYAVPDTTWTSSGDSTGTVRVLGLPVALQGGIASGTATIGPVVIAGARSDGARDLAASPYAAGDQVAYTFRVTNTGTAAVTVAPTAGGFSPLVPPGTGNCRYTSLAPGASYTCSTPRHTVTAAEAAQGYFVPDTTWTVSGPAGSVSSRVLGAPVGLS
jgi:sialidase-1